VVTARRDLAAAIRAARPAGTGYRPGTGRITKVNAGPTAVVDLGGGQQITCRYLSGYAPAVGHTVVIFWATDTMPILLGRLA
jgi:hypothetical protein